MRRYKYILLWLMVLLASETSADANYRWPLSNSATPDEMNTSFGPRINYSKWDFHDGLDLPAPLGTPVYAVRGGIVYRAGPRGSDGYSSRHIVLKVQDPTDGELYVVHLHLNSIQPAVQPNASITEGQLLGTVGDDDAGYPHLHIEFRKGTPLQIGSVHPLKYLPYTNTTNTPNFRAPVLNRFNRLGNLMAARLFFSAPSKLEGDLKRVEVDLRSGASLLETRVVDFNDKTTINEGNGDEYTYVNNIGVEGYQTSNMVADGRVDLKYGILARNLPSSCDTLVARVIDLGNNVSTSAPISVPNQTALEEKVDFEDGAMPPLGWTAVTSTSTAGITVTNETTAAYVGTRGMQSLDSSATETTTQRAGLERPLPLGRFEWVAEGWFKPSALGLAPGQAIYLIYFKNGANLSLAARIFNSSGLLLAGIIAKKPDGSLTAINSDVNIDLNVWRRWKLQLLRVATRETTAVLYLDGSEKGRLNWDSTVYEPLEIRFGLGLTSAGATATLLSDDLQLTEKTRSSIATVSPPSTPGSTPPAPSPEAWDVNDDGEVNIFDIVIVARNIGQVGQAVKAGDVNGDGKVDLADLVTVVSHFGERRVMRN